MFSVPFIVSKHIERVYVTTYLTAYAPMQWRAEYRNCWATESATNIVFVPIPKQLIYGANISCVFALAVLCCAVRFFKNSFLRFPSRSTRGVIFHLPRVFVTHTSSFLELWFSMRSFSRPHTYTIYYLVQCSNASISGEIAIQLCASGTRRRPRLSAAVDQSIRSLDYKEAQQGGLAKWTEWASENNRVIRIPNYTKKKEKRIRNGRDHCQDCFSSWSVRYFVAWSNRLLQV
jgi:hypothetical protein